MDSFDDYVGLVIVLLFFLLPVLRAVVLKKRKKQEPPPQKVKPYFEEEPYYEEEEVYAPPPPVIMQQASSLTQFPAKSRRTVKKDFEFHSNLESREFSSEITDRHLETNVGSNFRKRIVSQSFILEKKKQRGQRLAPLEHLSLRYSSAHSLVVFTEVMGRPKWEDVCEREY